jgi:hypothetical protein
MALIPEPYKRPQGDAATALAGSLETARQDPSMLAALLDFDPGKIGQQEDPEYQDKLRKAQEKKQREPDWDYDGYVRALNSAYGK